MLRFEKLVGFLVGIAMAVAIIVAAGRWILEDSERVIAVALATLIALAGVFLWWRVAKILPSRENDKPND